MHTYIHTYIHTCIHTRLYTYICIGAKANADDIRADARVSADFVLHCMMLCHLWVCHMAFLRQLKAAPGKHMHKSSSNVVAQSEARATIDAP